MTHSNAKRTTNKAPSLALEQDNDMSIQTIPPYADQASNEIDTSSFPIQLTRSFRGINADGTWNDLRLLEVTFPNDDNKQTNLIITRSQLNHPIQLRDLLDEKGMAFYDPKIFSDNIVHIKKTIKFKKVEPFVHLPGWFFFENWWHFVSPLNPKGQKIFFKAGKAVKVPAFCVKGSLVEFKKAARKAAYSIPMRVAMSASLSALLLTPLGYDSYGMLIVGDTSVGKSTILMGCSAIYGHLGSKGLKNLSNTAVSIAQEIQGCRDSAYVPDDLGQVAGGNDVKTNFLSDLAMKNLNGTTSEKSSQYEEANGIISSEVHTVCICSAENAPNPRDGGAEVRFFTLPITAFGTSDIFTHEATDLRVGDTGDKRALVIDWLKDIFKNNQGVVFETFLTCLNNDKTAFIFVEEAINEFNAKTTNLASGGASNRMRKSFAISYGAAKLAIKYEVFPWDANETLDDHIAAYKVALHAALSAIAAKKRQSPNAALTDKELLNQFFGELKEQKLVTLDRNKKVTSRKIKAVAGAQLIDIIERGKNGSNTLCLHKAAMRQLYPHQGDFSRLISLLRQKKLILTESRQDSNISQVKIPVEILKNERVRSESQVFYRLKPEILKFIA